MMFIDGKQRNSFSSLWAKRGLETSRLLLRPPKLSDARQMFSYARDERVARYVLWDAHRHLGDSRKHLWDLIIGNFTGQTQQYSVIEKASGLMIGTAGFVRFDKDNQMGEIGYSLGYDYWGKGYAKELLSALLRHGFTRLSLERIEGLTDARNEASARVMLACGMREEGYLRGCMMLKGVRVDVRLFAKLRSDV